MNKSKIKLLDMMKETTKADISKIFGVTQRTLQNWKSDFEDIGATNKNGTIDCIKVIRWQIKKLKDENNEKTTDRFQLELIKLQKDIDYKDAQISKILEKYVEKSVADQKMAAMLRIIREFLEKVPEYRKQEFHMIPADTACLRLRKVLKESMEQIANAQQDIDE